MALIGHLSNMVNMMNRSIGDYSSLERLSRESQMFGKRRRAVQWMKEVTKYVTKHAGIFKTIITSNHRDKMTAFAVLINQFNDKPA